MLPGFRFLFAAITLSVSILVFGLGAAALLRAAHEEFASNSSWRAAPEQPIIAQQNDQAKPVLAMLRFDPPHPVVKTREPAPAQEATPAAVTEAPALASSAEKNAVALPAPEAKTAEAKTAEAKSAEAKSAEAKPAETKPAEAKLTDVKPTDVTTVAALETKDAALPAETTKTEDPPAAAVVTNDTKPTPVVATDASVKADEAAREDTKVAALDAAKPSAGLVPPATDIA